METVVYIKLLKQDSVWYNSSKVALVTQLCPTLCDPVDQSLLDASLHGIPQARILQWVAVPFSKGSSLPRDRIWVSCIAGRSPTPSNDDEERAEGQGHWPACIVRKATTSRESGRGC